MNSRTLLLAAGLLAATALPARAGLTLTIGDLELAVGQTGYVDVWIESTDGAEKLLQLFDAEFRIVGGVTRLEFVAPQSESYLADPAYVFAGDSFNFEESVTGSIVVDTDVPGDTLLLSDSTHSLADVSVTTSRLLARLEVTADTFLPPVVGDSFTIQFIDGLFADFEFNFHDISSTSGTVTIVAGSLAPVPEPSSLAVGLLAALGAVAWTRARREVDRDQVVDG